jgi:hypothetical protein
MRRLTIQYFSSNWIRTLLTRLFIARWCKLLNVPLKETVRLSTLPTAYPEAVLIINNRCLLLKGIG